MPAQCSLNETFFHNPTNFLTYRPRVRPHPGAEAPQDASPRLMYVGYGLSPGLARGYPRYRSLRDLTRGGGVCGRGGSVGFRRSGGGDGVCVCGRSHSRSGRIRSHSRNHSCIRSRIRRGVRRR